MPFAVPGLVDGVFGLTMMALVQWVAGDALPPPAAVGTLVFGGDAIPHAAVQASIERHGPRSAFAPVAPIIAAADLAFANLETPVAPSQRIIRGGPPFNAPMDFLVPLTAVGFDGVTVANNHSFDAGSLGLGETLAMLRTAALPSIGGASPGEALYAPTAYTLAGRTLCAFAATRLINRGPDTWGPDAPRIVLARWNHPYEEEALLEAIRRHRPRCGAVIIAVHAGREFQDYPDAEDARFFHALADAGADAVIGMHSHTPQPVERYRTGDRDVPIFYSLGNLLSHQGMRADESVDPWYDGTWHRALDPRLREGLLAVVRFEAASPTRLRVAAFGYVPLWTVNTMHLEGAGIVPTVAAALMPRDGGGDPMLTRRWRALVERVGAEFLLPIDDVPGAADAYRLSNAAVLETRRAAVTALAPPASAGPVVRLAE
jgi:hypothetical protein